jgi:radical SAM superfamily enzyme YgiQ (UPF0313 family)
MARVLLIHAALGAGLRYGALAWAGARLPGLGILYIAGALRKAGHRVMLADTTEPGFTPKNLADAARAFAPTLVGISATSASMALAGRLAGLLKGAVPDAAFVIGGPHASALPEQTLNDLAVFDFAVAGEGEQAAVELADLLDSKEKDFAPPAGVWARQADKLVRGPMRQPVKNLDELAHPAWDLLKGFPLAYSPAVFRYQKKPAAQMVTSRGCPHSCIFCAKTLGKSLRLASPECVLDQALILNKKFSVCEIAFEDDHFLADKDRAAAICELLAKNLPGLSFSISSRADAIDDKALLALLRRAGCWQINLGIESADQKILDNSGKGLCLMQVENALALIAGAKIKSKGFFILGLLGESRASMEKSLNFACKSPLNDVSVFFATPFPGTGLYKKWLSRRPFAADFSAMTQMQPFEAPDGLPAKTLAAFHKHFIRSFYLQGRVVKDYMGRLAAYPANALPLAKGLAAWALFTRKG